MPTSKPVVAGVDGSPDSDRALGWALEAAHDYGAPLHVVHVWPYVVSLESAMADVTDPLPESGDPVIDRAREALGGLPEPPSVTYRPLSGFPETFLPGLGEGARMLVLGSRGRGGFASLLLGSVSLTCAAHAPCPVVVVRHREGDAGPAPGSRTGVVTLGLPATARTAAAGRTASAEVEFAFEEARRHGARLRVLTGYAPPASLMHPLEPLPGPEWEAPEIARRLTERLEEVLAPYRERYPGVGLDAAAAPGDAAGLLVDASRTSDLVVVGRGRRSRPLGRRLGSVAHAVLLHALCPVAVVPQPGRPVQEI